MERPPPRVDRRLITPREVGSRHCFAHHPHTEERCKEIRGFLGPPSRRGHAQPFRDKRCQGGDMLSPAWAASVPHRSHVSRCRGEPHCWCRPRRFLVGSHLEEHGAFERLAAGSAAPTGEFCNSGGGVAAEALAKGRFAPFFGPMGANTHQTLAHTTHLWTLGGSCLRSRFTPDFGPFYSPSAC